jgi:transposase
MARPADDFGPYTTCYNRFIRWRRAGVWGPIMDALATAHVASVQMIELDCLCLNPSGPWPADLRTSFARLDPTKRRGMK